MFSYALESKVQKENKKMKKKTSLFPLFSQEQITTMEIRQLSTILRWCSTKATDSFEKEGFNRPQKSQSNWLVGLLPVQLHSWG